jgi:hypothetical protein
VVNVCPGLFNAIDEEAERPEVRYNGAVSAKIRPIDKMTAVVIP